MLDRASQEKIAKRLEDSGVYIYARQRDGGGNVRKTEEVPWSVALVRIVQLMGWGFAIQDEDTPVISIDRGRETEALD